MKEHFTSWVVQLQALAQDPIGLLPTEPDDMWHIYYNLIAPGDLVMSETTRKQVHLVGQPRVHCILGIRVEDISYSSDTNEIRCKGINVVESQDAAMGAYHSLVLQLGKPFAMGKKAGWDAIARRQLEEALRGSRDRSLVAVVMQEGLANICLITEARTIIKRRLEKSITSKRSGPEQMDRIAADTRAFYDMTLAALRQEIDFEVYGDRPLLFASPGFVAANFRKHILKKSMEGEGTDKQLANLAKNVQVVHSSTGHVHALNAILEKAEIRKLIQGMRSVKEGEYLDMFHKTMKVDECKAWYGISDVEKLVRQGHLGASSILMVGNALFRSSDVEKRKMFTAMVQKVEAAGGEVVIFGGHEAAEGLELLGNIAAILPYPVYELEDEEEEEARAGQQAENELALEGMVV